MKTPTIVLLFATFWAGCDTPEATEPADPVTTEDTGTPPDATETGEPPEDIVENSTYAPLPEPTNALAAAVLDDVLYTYGGAIGEMHVEDNESFVSQTRRLDLATPGAQWEEISGSGIPTQQAVMFTHDGKLYRVGGLMAANDPGTDSDLWSLSDFAVYDPDNDAWTALPDMPSTRASHSVGIHDGVLHVMGGWEYLGSEGGWEYHTTFVTYDLESATASWEVHSQPFQVRDHCGGEKDGFIYLIGGMLSGTFPDAPYVYEVATGTWSEGPQLLIDSVYKGFGCASASVDGELYFSGADGVVYRLTDTRTDWEAVATLDPQRTFHRLPARSPSELIAVGGGEGYLVEATDLVESIPLPE